MTRSTVRPMIIRGEAKEENIYFDRFYSISWNSVIALVIVPKVFSLEYLVKVSIFLYNA